MLLVPAVVSKEVSYDDAYRRSQEEIKKAIPVAEETGVRIAFENVWNNFLVSPLEAARYIDEFQSPTGLCPFRRRQRAALRLARAVDSDSWPAHLQARHQGIQPDENEGRGNLQGIQRPAARRRLRLAGRDEGLREINYSGWGAAEVPGGGRDRLADISQRMDRILAS